MAPRGKLSTTVVLQQSWECFEACWPRPHGFSEFETKESAMETRRTRGCKNHFEAFVKTVRLATQVSDNSLPFELAKGSSSSGIVATHGLAEGISLRSSYKDKCESPYVDAISTEVGLDFNGRVEQAGTSKFYCLQKSYDVGAVKT